MREMNRKARRNNYVPHKSSSNLCPNCLSEMIVQNSEYVCSGNRYAFWKDEIDKYKNFSKTEKEEYLKTIANPSKFLEMVDNISNFECVVSNRINNTISSQNTRIPDPLAQLRLEKKLKRQLLDVEMEEGHKFVVNGQVYTLPFINFPEDI